MQKVALPLPQRGVEVTDSIAVLDAAYRQILGMHAQAALAADAVVLTVQVPNFPADSAAQSNFVDSIEALTELNRELRFQVTEVVKGREANAARLASTARWQAETLNRTMRYVFVEPTHGFSNPRMTPSEPEAELVRAIRQSAAVTRLCGVTLLKQMLTKSQSVGTDAQADAIESRLSDVVHSRWRGDRMRQSTYCDAIVLIETAALMRTGDDPRLTLREIDVADSMDRAATTEMNSLRAVAAVKDDVILSLTQPSVETSMQFSSDRTDSPGLVPLATVAAQNTLI